MTTETQIPMLEIRDIKRDYHVPGGFLKPAKTVSAVKGVSFSLDKGKTLAIVGESGCTRHAGNGQQQADMALARPHRADQDEVGRGVHAAIVTRPVCPSPAR